MPALLYNNNLRRPQNEEVSPNYLLQLIFLVEITNSIGLNLPTHVWEVGNMLLFTYIIDT